MRDDRFMTLFEAHLGVVAENRRRVVSLRQAHGEADGISLEGGQGPSLARRACDIVMAVGMLHSQTKRSPRTECASQQ